LPAAAALTSRWRQRHPEAIKAARFDRAACDRLLAHPEAAGIRIYLGEKADGSWTYVMVATAKDGRDLVPAVGATDQQAGLAEEADPCPPDCDPTSPLSQGSPPT
jgi:hypothetical protein